jgi:hypothetical protein
MLAFCVFVGLRRSDCILDRSRLVVRCVQGVANVDGQTKSLCALCGLVRWRSATRTFCCRFCFFHGLFHA